MHWSYRYLHSWTSNFLAIGMSYWMLLVNHCFVFRVCWPSFVRVCLCSLTSSIDNAVYSWWFLSFNSFEYSFYLAFYKWRFFIKGSLFKDICHPYIINILCFILIRCFSIDLLAEPFIQACFSLKLLNCANCGLWQLSVFSGKVF